MSVSTPAISTFDLSAHPTTPCPAVQRIRVDVERDAQRLRLRYALKGDLGALSIPAPAAQRRADELWRHTCCEAFVRIDDAAGYVELNFSPSTEWAMYRFDGYRAGMRAVTESESQVRRATEARRLLLDAEVDLASLGAAATDTLQLALTAVVESADGRIAYFALAHAPGKPDFHHAAGFVARIPPVAGARTI